MQKCRRCKQGHQDHAEDDNAYIEAYAEQDEHKVFEDYFQVQVAPCNGLMHCVQYLMLFHAAGVCGSGASTAGSAAGCAHSECMRYACAPAKAAYYADRVWDAGPRVMRDSEGDTCKWTGAVGRRMRAGIGGRTCGMSTLARSPQRSLAWALSKTSKMVLLTLRASNILPAGRAWRQGLGTVNAVQW